MLLQRASDHVPRYAFHMLRLYSGIHDLEPRFRHHMSSSSYFFYFRRCMLQSTSSCGTTYLSPPAPHLKTSGKRLNHPPQKCRGSTQDIARRTFLELVTLAQHPQCLQVLYELLVSLLHVRYTNTPQHDGPYVLRLHYSRVPLPSVWPPLQSSHSIRSSCHHAKLQTELM